MYFQRVHCLHVKGISLDEPTLRLFMWGACQMSRQQEREHVIELQEGEVVLTTRYETGLMGHIAGIEFTADIAIGHRQAQVSFLVSEDNLQTVTTPKHTQDYCLIQQMKGSYECN